MVPSVGPFDVRSCSPVSGHQFDSLQKYILSILAVLSLRLVLDVVHFVVLTVLLCLFFI